MITVMDSIKGPMKVYQDKCLDPQLWHACAGNMVQMPLVNSKVFYFPQGHAENANGPVDFGNLPIPSLVPCRVSAIRYMADTDTDEVFAKIRLVPLRDNDLGFDHDDSNGFNGNNGGEDPEKPASFAKTLTQSDANNGGGFSVPRYCAETIFPRLDYNAEPPVQNILAKDVHGEVWKFRHIYRGTPRRHLLTTGWSNFVNQKKLVAGDSIVFLRAENGDLCIGIRRAKRGIGNGLDFSSGWNPIGGNGGSQYGGLMQRHHHHPSNVVDLKGRVRVESVIEAATLAANKQTFEVVYYPRGSTAEFCVKASGVRSAMQIQWCSNMRFKMAFETEDSSRISWFMGTISSVQVADPIRWPNSPWRLLQVAWDEPDLLQNVKRVSPWLVELVSHIPAIHLTPFSPPRKKMRLPQHSDFSLLNQVPLPSFSSNLLRSSSSYCCIPDNINIPAGIQGARHAQYGLSSSTSDLNFNRLHSSGIFPVGFQKLDHHPVPPPTRFPRERKNGNDDISCLLTIGNSNPSLKTSNETTTSSPHFFLFGKLIPTQKMNSESSSGDTIGNNSLSDGITEKPSNSSDGPHDNSSDEGSPWRKVTHNKSDLGLGLELGHCKVFMESEDVGRTLDLSVFKSYEELYGKLANMFGVENSEMLSNILYRDAAGSVKHAGGEPFSEFLKSARRLTILTDSSSDNVGMIQR